ncbi:GlxA family transcriptional regulator [Psychrobacter sp.]|uniref:GlxA family transcriptional regulator n=1 Tax=Psychrobacter sp. TaxID=56811 RepID=UPI003F9D97B3
MTQITEKMIDKPRRIGFLLINGFTMLAFSNIIEPLRMANYVSEQLLYSWVVAGFDDNKTSSSNGIKLSHTAPLDYLLTCDLVFVCGGHQTDYLESSKLITLIQRLAVRDIALGGLCTGALALAAAGLLEQQAASLHWENISVAQESYPGVIFNDQIFTIAPQLYSCSGGACALDMTLHIIKKHHGHHIVSKIQDMFIITSIREPTYVQHMPKPKILSSSYTNVIDAIALMKTNLEEPLSVKDIAHHLGLSSRQLQRIFNKNFSCSPQQYYVRLRLEHAKYILKHTTLPISQIVLASGFIDNSAFSSTFKKNYGMTPSHYRQENQLI